MRPGIANSARFSCHGAAPCRWCPPPVPYADDCAADPRGAGRSRSTLLVRKAHDEQEGGAVKVRPARIEDAVAVAEIYNQGILSRAATFETQPRTAADRLGIIEAQGDRYPILVAEGEMGEIMGWAALSEHSPRACYRGIAECSVFVETGHRGRGVGTELMSATVREARTLGYWKLISR